MDGTQNECLSIKRTVDEKQTIRTDKQQIGLSKLSCTYGQNVCEMKNSEVEGEIENKRTIGRLSRRWAETLEKTTGHSLYKSLILTWGTDFVQNNQALKLTVSPSLHKAQYTKRRMVMS